MAVMGPRPAPEHLRAILDMGSNGIRFSITDLSPPTARIMPTLYQHRVGISLYDAQWSASGQRQPISQEITGAVITSFNSFQRSCSDFGVLDENITVLATEATRTAINSEEFRAKIKDALGWDVTLMPKEEEGRVGAMGIASSLPEVNGLVMDLGGGSTQLSWLSTDNDGHVIMPESGAVSMPYGAAAMSRRLSEATEYGKIADLENEVRAAMKNAFKNLNVPSGLMQRTRGKLGFTVFLSGGGFRGWGYLLMSRHQVQPYPIPVINGFVATTEQFLDTKEVESAAAAALKNENDEVFRISDRRASQVPAVSFLIKALAHAIPEVTEVRFCQGGVREGYLFSSLPNAIQIKQPLVVATKSFSQDCSHIIQGLLKNALPPGHVSSDPTKVDDVFSSELIEAFANTMFVHSTHSKDLQASAALRFTTSGILAGVHGLTHESRTILALLLCARWGDEIPPIDAVFKQSLEKLVSGRIFLWFIRYLGSIAALIAAIYPAGVPGKIQSKRLALKSCRLPSDTEYGKMQLQVSFGRDLDEIMLAKEIKNIEKIGKKKNWVGGKGGVGLTIDIVVDNSGLQ